MSINNVMLLPIIGFILGSIIVYILTLIELYEDIRENKIVAGISFAISIIINFCNMILPTTMYAYLSAGFTSVIMSSLPFFTLSFCKKRKLEKLLIEKKECFPLIGSALIGYRRYDPKLDEILENMLKYFKELLEQGNIGIDQYKELKAIKPID